MKNVKNARQRFFSKMIRELKFHLISDYNYSVRKFRKIFNVSPDLDNPERFNEKILHRMLYDDNELFTVLADKIKARSVVASEIGEEYLIPLLGVYDDVNSVNIHLLPDKFVLKCSHDSNSCIICEDKSIFDWAMTKNKLIFCLEKNMYHSTREKHYSNITPKIICEQFVDVYCNSDRGTTPELYRIHCFSGKPHYIEVDFNIESGKHTNIYDVNWNIQDVTVGCPSLLKEIPPPEKLDELLSLSATLSKKFDYCRMDWFISDNKVYFNEYTFTPCAGRMKFEPSSYDYIFGKLWR